ncbi:hypothetical protein GCK32_001923 [Trichostrongylus colubriformis]|uniref:Uncharacterized protein n=1 Tax=Trichostrongylus colubriformis TaxID=6319 RepID=A0AAN8INW7_TRICO
MLWTIDILERSFDELLLNSDAEDIYMTEDDTNALVPAVALNEEDFDSEDTPDDDDDEDETDAMWMDEAKSNDRWVFNEPREFMKKCSVATILSISIDSFFRGLAGRSCYTNEHLRPSEKPNVE